LGKKGERREAEESKTDDPPPPPPPLPTSDFSFSLVKLSHLSAIEILLQEETCNYSQSIQFPFILYMELLLVLEAMEPSAFGIRTPRPN